MSAKGRRAHSKVQEQQPTTVVPSMELLYKSRGLGSAKPVGAEKVRALLVSTLSWLRNGGHTPKHCVRALPDILV